MIKRYKITFDWWDCVIEFDTTKFGVELLNECLNFYSWDYDEDNDPYEEYAKKLGEAIIIESMDFNCKGVIGRFENKEGYPYLDGDMGVTLISCDAWEFDSDEFEIEEL